VPLGYLTETGVITTIYVATATIGFLLAMPPGNLTTPWPASGLALAAILLRGNRAAVAVWIGSFLVDFLFFFPPADAGSPVAAVAAGIATGCTLQALLGASLVRWRFGDICPPERVRAVLTFLGLVALSCLVGAACGVLSLYLGGGLRGPSAP
jgi:integral membrane sensor domain MASE1